MTISTAIVRGSISGRRIEPIGGIKKDGVADGLFLGAEPGDILGTTFFQDREIGGGESVHVAALPVSNLKGKRL
jgi:hypothetical protein